MLFLLWILLFLIAACVIFFMPALWGKHVYNEYRGSRIVVCPESHTPVSVRFDALRAAISSLNGKPKLSLASCTRWPERANCDQACIPDARRAVPVSQGSVALPSPNRIANLPVLVAASAAWVLGVVWHSEYVFRSPWAKSVGLTDQQAHDLARTWTPHLLTVAACLLFCYAVAGLLSWLGARTAIRGIQVAFGLWLLVAAIFLCAGRWNFGSSFFWIDGGYTLLASILIGIIVGAVPRRVFLTDEKQA